VRARGAVGEDDDRPVDEQVVCHNHIGGGNRGKALIRRGRARKGQAHNKD